MSDPADVRGDAGKPPVATTPTMPLMTDQEFLRPSDAAEAAAFRLDQSQRERSRQQEKGREHTTRDQLRGDVSRAESLDQRAEPPAAEAPTALDILREAWAMASDEDRTKFRREIEE